MAIVFMVFITEMIIEGKNNPAQKFCIYSSFCSLLFPLFSQIVQFPSLHLHLNGDHGHSQNLSYRTLVAKATRRCICKFVYLFWNL